MSLWDRIKAANRKGILERISPDYKVDPKIFRWALFACLVVAVIAWATSGFQVSAVSYSCPAGGPPCFNPYNPVNHPDYLRPYVREQCPDAELCEIVRFSPGETWGPRPSFLMEYFIWIAGGIMAVASVYNHVKNNKEGGK